MLVAEFSADDSVWVAGAYCRPANAMDIEKAYWEFRYMETNAMSSSIVTAPCYAFRRELLTAFPDDTVSDDVYIALLASVNHPLPTIFFLKRLTR